MHINDDDSPWEVNEKVDLLTGKITRSYSYKRRSAARICLSDGIASQYAGYSLIEKDLRNILIWIEFLEDSLAEWETDLGSYLRGRRHKAEHFAIVKGIYIAAITTYGKCFNQCAGRRIRIDPSWIDEDHKDSHQFAILTRNNFTAHSGEAKFEVANVVLVIDRKKTSNALPLLATEINQPDSIGYTELADFKALVESLHKKVRRKQDQLHQKIFENCLKQGRDYWLKQ